MALPNWNFSDAQVSVGPCASTEDETPPSDAPIPTNQVPWYAHKYARDADNVARGRQLSDADRLLILEGVYRAWGWPGKGYEKQKGAHVRAADNPRLGRNEKCPCGCDRKVKHCPNRK